MICGFCSVVANGVNYRHCDRIWSWLSVGRGLRGQHSCHKVVGESSNFSSLLVSFYSLWHYQFMPFIVVEAH
jgi:hypothetical protein